jgi:cytochrome c-type biogenesis protein CcmF
MVALRIRSRPPDRSADRGEELNPLLQNFYMAIHPPSLYTGFVGMTIPFAFGVAALVTGHLDDSWLRAVRRWTMFSWLFLSFGLTLRMIWACESRVRRLLGVDRSRTPRCCPWFTATAFCAGDGRAARHAAVWSTPVIVTFFDHLRHVRDALGRRRGQYAFGDDPVLARLFIGFGEVILTFSFGLVIWQLRCSKARNELDSWLSREAAFLVNNWVMFAALSCCSGRCSRR